MIGKLRILIPLFCVAAAHLFFLLHGAMLGCSFHEPMIGNVDDNMDDPNFYTCDCDCVTSLSQTVQVSAGGDDAEQTGVVNIFNDPDGAADLDLGLGPVGIRFVGLGIPPGAVITRAQVQFTADQSFGSDNSGAANLQIVGEAADNAASFGGSVTDLNARTPTAASVAWSPPPWSVAESGPAELTPDLSFIVHEIVDRPGWKFGNALVLIVSGSGRREAESFDGNPQRAARLEVEFLTGPTVDLHVCMPDDLNPNLQPTPQPTPTDDQLQLDCRFRVQPTLVGLANSCNYPSQCVCNAVAGSRQFNAACNSPCSEVPLDASCSNFDPAGGNTTATNGLGNDPVCVAERAPGDSGPRPMSAALFGMRSECQVAGPATVMVGDESKMTDAQGIVDFSGPPCPGAQCSLGLTYDLGLDPITFDVNFLSHPTFDDLAASGASVADAALVGPSGFGMTAAQVTESSARGRRDSDTRAFIVTNPNPLGVFIGWDDHLCALFGNIVGTVDSETHGDAGLSAEVSLQGPVINEPPAADAGADQQVECSSPDGAPIVLDGTASRDPEDNLVIASWFRGSRVGELVGSGETVGLQQALGATTTYVLRVIDAFGQTSEDATTVGVVDTTPPALSLSVSPSTLWPPNHKLVPVTVTIIVSDACDPHPTIRLVSITSNEDGANGSGHTSPDVQEAELGTDDRQFLLRAERSGGGSGRVYTIAYEAEDSSGNMTVREVTVTVPKSQGAS